MEGIAKLHELVARHGGEDLGPAAVIVGIETDRGSWVQALIVSGYQVYAINPRQVARFKERYGTSGAKSDALESPLVLAAADPSHDRRVVEIHMRQSRLVHEPDHVEHVVSGARSRATDLDDAKRGIARIDGGNDNGRAYVVAHVSSLRQRHRGRMRA